MANYPKWYAEIGLRDGVLRNSRMVFRVPEATAKLYFAAADKAARDATAIGGLLTACLTVTQMTETYRKVWVEDETAPVTTLADTILRGNKVTVGYESGADNFVFTIPARDASAYTQNADQLSIDIEAAGDFKTFYELVETVCIGPTGLSLNVTKAYIND